MIENIQDSDCVGVGNFNLFKYTNFDLFNPVQSAVLPYSTHDKNAVISASTSSGKTVIAEFYIADTLINKKKKIVYVSPLKALAHEKYSEWKKNNLFSTYKIGFYTENDVKKDDYFDIGIFTIEGFCHKLFTKADLFIDLDAVIVDEAHLLGVQDRGHIVEFVTMIAALQNARIIYLSGTLANGIDIAEWLSKLNNKPTVYLSSKYRPVPLNIQYKKYDEDNFDGGVPESLLGSILSLVKKYNSDKFIVFVHSKQTGKRIKKMLLENNINSDFHSADLKSSDRTKLENDFKNGNIRVLVATSTLAAGVNLPARRVIISGVTRGKQLVDKAEINQMIGRAGRKGIDDAGDVYVFVPNNKSFVASEMNKLEPVVSCLLEISKKEIYENLILYILGLIYNKKFNNFEDIKYFINKSFSRIKNKNNTYFEICYKNTCDLILNYKLAEFDAQNLKITKLGALSLQFFIHPLDVFHYSVSFSKLFKQSEIKDSVVSYTLANLPSNKSAFMSNEEKVFCTKYEQRLIELMGTNYYQSGTLKIGFAYYCLMTGKNLGPLFYLREPLQKDIGRICSCLSMMSKINGWDKSQFFNLINKRILYGVKPELIPLVEIHGIGKVRAEKLYEAGFRNKLEIENSLERASKILGLSVESFKQVCQLGQKNPMDIQS